MTQRGGIGLIDFGIQSSKAGKHACSVALVVSYFQLFVTLMDCSLPGSSVHGDFPGKNTGVGCYLLFQGIFSTQGLKPHLLCLLHWHTSSLPLAPPGKPYIQSTSCEMPSWMKLGLESRLLGEISITSDMQMAPPYGRK